MSKTVLITGASAGIGYELSKVFAKNGYNLVLVSRNKQRLEVIAKELENQHDIQAKVIPKDLSKSFAPQEPFYPTLRYHFDNPFFKPKRRG